MIKSLCFLKSLTDFNIKNNLFKENRMSHQDDLLLIKYEDINQFLNYIKNEKNELKSFETLIKSNKEIKSKINYI